MYQSIIFSTPDIAKSLESVLARRDTKFEHFTDKETCKQYIAHVPVDIAFFELGFSQGDSFELISYIRSTIPHLYLVGLIDPKVTNYQAYANFADIFGMDKHIDLPVERSQLDEIMSTLSPVEIRL